MKQGIRCKVCGWTRSNGIQPVFRAPVGASEFTHALAAQVERATPLVTKVQTPAERQRRHRKKENHAITG